MAALLIKESVNQTQDNQGFYNSLNACFTMHELNHAHWAIVHDDGMAVAKLGEDVPDWRGTKLKPSQSDTVEAAGRSMSDVLLRERRGGVELLTLNRPEKRNALNKELLTALADTFAELETDDAVNAIVLTGAGDKAFCAGMDLAEFAAGGGGGSTVAEQTGEDDDAVVPERHQIVSWEYPKPLVAALNGATVGGGFEIMMACDLVVAAEHVKFGLAEVKRGLMPGGGGTLLATRIPLTIALEITLTGETFDAARALELGLGEPRRARGHARSTRRSRSRRRSRRTDRSRCAR